jgi:hypothetical protein
VEVDSAVVIAVWWSLYWRDSTRSSTPGCICFQRGSAVLMISSSSGNAATVSTRWPLSARPSAGQAVAHALAIKRRRRPVAGCDIGKGGRGGGCGEIENLKALSDARA